MGFEKTKPQTVPAMQTYGLEHKKVNTTIKISKPSGIIWKQWCKAKNMTSVELMDELIEVVKRKKQQAFYLSLPKIDNRTKRLLGVKIQKKYTVVSGA
jgi:sensor domain CHASE-containing protein